MPSTPFCTILTIFAKFKYEIDFDKLAITLQPSRNEELCPFPILIEKYRVLQLLWYEKYQSSWRSFYVSLPKFDLFLFYLMERTASATCKILQANWVVLVDFLINVRKNCHFWSCSISNSVVGICDIYLEKSLLNFLCFNIGKTIPVYIPTHLVISFI